jgi:uncharacterized protein YecE (DUF72 family)
MRALADRLPDTLHLGTSSWAFPGWAGLVYDREHAPGALSREGLGAYAQHPLLRAVGLDRSFYAPVSEPAFVRYAGMVPPHFRFLVKAHAALTTPRGMRVPGHSDGADRFLDAAYATDAVFGPAARGLRARLGVVLLQFPPLSLGARELQALPERLARFLEQLPRDIPCAVEVRNAALLTPEYARALAHAGATHCFNVHPTMPGVLQQAEMLGESVRQSGPVCVRWMLRPDQRYESARDAYAPFDRLVAPDVTSRAQIADLISIVGANTRPVIVVVNNKAEGSAPRSIVELARLLSPAE